MSDTRMNKKDVYVLQAVQTAESAEFTAIYGSNAQPKWFEGLMTYSGTYLFSLALVFSVIKLGIGIYQFIKSPNKNINETTSLGLSILNNTLIGIAIVGVLAAATTFALITPALMVVTLGLDTIRNLGLFVWNIGKLASLKFQLSNQLKDDSDPLTKLKYDALKEKYLTKIKQHAWGSVISPILTLAAGVIFLSPHIGLPALGLTTITIAGLKTTVAAILGVAAAVAIMVPTIPIVGKFLMWGGSQIKNGIKSAFTYIKSTLFKKNENIPNNSVQRDEEQTLIQKNVVVAKVPRNKNFTISNDQALTKAFDHHLEFNAYTLDSQFRETIINHIDDPVLARKALQKMVSDKISALMADLQKEQSGGYFAKKQRPKREQKLHALLLIKEHFKDKFADEFQFDHYKSAFKNVDIIVQSFRDKSSYSLEALVSYIDTSLPSVKDSFFLDQSDTQNIVEALKVFVAKFPELSSANAVALAPGR